MGFWRYLSGDATHLGTADRGNENKKGIELSSRLSANTILHANFVLPWNENNFYKTYSQGSQLESAAIRNAQNINKGNSIMASSRQSFILQRACCEEVMKKLEIFIGDNNNILKLYDQNIDSLRGAELMSDFFERLDVLRDIYKENILSLNSEAQSHINALAKQVIYLNDTISEWSSS